MSPTLMSASAVSSPSSVTSPTPAFSAAVNSRSSVTWLSSFRSVSRIIGVNSQFRESEIKLDDRKVNLQLFQPTGIHGRRDQDRLAVGLPQSPRGFIAHLLSKIS